MAALFQFARKLPILTQTFTKLPTFTQTIEQTTNIKQVFTASPFFKRNFTGRVFCEIDPFPRCSPKNIQASKCYKRKLIEKIVNFPFKHLLPKESDCCGFCKDFGSFDDLYYKPLLLKDRKFYRTWKKCESPIIKTKCINSIADLLPLPYKKRVQIGDVAHHCKTYNVLDFSNLMACHRYPPPECPRIGDKRCKAVRMPPRCRVDIPRLPCIKKCAPYPAFSECIRPDIKKKRRVECDCHTPVSLCFFHRLLQKGFTGYKY